MTEDQLYARYDELHARVFAEGQESREPEVFAGLNDQDQTIFLLLKFETEVNNGGFHQYFLNTGAAFAAPSLKVLHKLGADQTAKLLEQAILVLGQQYLTANYAEVEDRLLDFKDAETEQLNDLDQQFYAYPDGDLLPKLSAWCDGEPAY